MEQNYKMVAKTLLGFEELLAKELLKLGAKNIQAGQRMVSFEGDKGFMYKANLALRTAIKILKPIHTCNVYNQESLYKGVSQVDWTQYMKPEQTFAIDSVVSTEHFNNSQFVTLKAKDAIVDKFRNLFGVRPSISKENPDIRINIHIHKEKCTISLDSSGASLHHRGYRSATNIAPINEVLAAGLIMLSGWEGQCAFLDPMCGSGTILIEAAMIACNVPANINRESFAFEKWQDFDAELYKTIYDNLLKKIRDAHFPIKGYDKAPSAVLKALDNVRNANFEEFITVEQKDFFESEKENEHNLHILFNPPYDERLSIDTEKFYESIGDTLKKKYTNTNAWIFTGNVDALKSVGLKTSKRIPLLNGSLDARLVKYEMYAGTKKVPKTDNSSTEMPEI